MQKYPYLIVADAINTNEEVVNAVFVKIVKKKNTLIFNRNFLKKKLEG